MPHGHSIARTARREIPRLLQRFLLAMALTACAIPAIASNPEQAPASTTAQATVATLAPADSVASIDLASPDNAPLAAQIAALQAAPTTTSRIRTVLQRAFALLGTPYRWGGTNPDSGFDCSGLVGYVFRTIGIDLPRVSRAMANEGTAITDRAALVEGDLVFFGKRGRVDHVGIYVGEGKFVHAPRTGRDVTVSSLASGYWSQKYLQARRLAADT
ncbi:C40 family peptidase [Thermomonas sp.]|uniref:C40 family peptidase n=1 Tax=Thermomonas sp. TaxID=1971895 RepID=UPI00387EA3F8